MPSVNWKRAEVRKRMNDWRMISDAIEGETAVKGRGTAYLPMPNAADQSNANVERFSAYLLRAVFYNVAGRTVRGMLGQIFARDPDMVVPAQLQPLVDDVTGIGTPMLQQVKGTARRTISHGRAGLLTEFTATEGDGATRAQIEEGEVRASIHRYEAEQIINWREERRGGETKYTLVIIEETYTKFAEGDRDFSSSEKKQHIVLRLDEEGFYVKQIYRDGLPVEAERYEPKQADGSRWPFIPWDFIGSEDNGPSVDPAPAYDLCSMNMAHYRNSADLEEMLHLIGQPTLVVAGLDMEWADKFMASGVVLGSRVGIPLPAGATADLLQIAESQLIASEMTRKEQRMVALGARLVENKTVQRTATEARQDETADGSVLSTISENVSAAYRNALWYANRFYTMDQPTAEQLKFTLNKQFDLMSLSPTDLAAVIKAWQDEAIAFPEMRSILRRSGYASISDTDAQALIEKEVKVRIDAANAALPSIQPGADDEE